MDCDCSLGYCGTCHWCNNILIYISIHTVGSSILMCNSFQNILEDRLSNKVKQTVLAFIIIACAISFYFLDFLCRYKQYSRLHCPSSESHLWFTKHLPSTLLIHTINVFYRKRSSIIGKTFLNIFTNPVILTNCMTRRSSTIKRL